MLDISLLIAPIFALLILGFTLRRNGIPSQEFWHQNDKLVYWVLMPSLLFYKTSTTDYDAALIGSFAVVILGSFACAIVFGILVWRLSPLSNATASSVMQGSSRNNTFISLALAERLYGSDGLALATLAMAMLIPVTNLVVVSLMVMINSEAKGIRVIPSILRDVSRNPLLLAVTAGILLNILVAHEIPVLHDMTRILGQAALPIMLLSVGASLRVKEMVTSVSPVLLAVIGKMILFPATALGLALMVGLTETQTMIVLLFATMPTASASYTLSRQMNGDAPVMASIITIQTGLSFFTIPISLFLAQMAFS